MRYAPLLAVAAGVWWWQSGHNRPAQDSADAPVIKVESQQGGASSASADDDIVGDIVRRLRLAELSGRHDLLPGLLARGQALAPDHPTVLFYRIYDHLANHRVEEAKQIYRHAQQVGISQTRLTQMASYIDSQTEASARLQQAKVLETAGRVDEALAEYRALFPAGMPTLRLQLDMLVLSYRAGDSWQSTRGKLEALDKQYPDFPDIELALANHYVRRSATEEQGWQLFRKLAQGPGLGRRAAGEWLQVLAAKDPTAEVLDAHALLARRYPGDLAVQQAYQRAQDERQAERERLRDPYYRAKRQGIAQLELGQNAAAERSLRFARRGRPDDEEVLGNLGLALIRLGRQDEAYPLLDRAVAVNRDPDMRGKWQTLRQTAAFWGGLQRASELSNSGRFEDARRQLDRASDIEPDNPALFIAYADWAEAQGRLNEALDYYHQALRRDPQSGSALRGSLRLRERMAGRRAALSWLDSLTVPQQRLLAEQRQALQMAMRFAELDSMVANTGVAGRPQRIQQQVDEVLAASDQGRSLSPWQRRQLAVTLRDLGDRRRADRLMKSWAAEDDDPEMQFAYALYLSGGGQVAAAQSVLQSVPASRRSEAMQRSLKRWEIDLALAAFAGEGENTLTAAGQERLDTLARAYEDDVGAQLRIAELWLQAGEPSRAAAMIDGMEPDESWTLQSQLDFGGLLIALSRFRQFELWYLGVDRRDRPLAEREALSDLLTRYRYRRAEASEAEGKTLLAYSFYHQAAQSPGPYRVPALIGVLRTSDVTGSTAVVEQSLDELSALMPSLAAPELVALAEEAQRQSMPTLRDASWRALLQQQGAPAYLLRSAALQAEAAGEWQVTQQLSHRAMQAHLGTSQDDTRTLYQQLGNDWLSNSLRASIDRQRERLDGHLKVALDFSERDSREVRWQLPVELRLPVPSLDGHMLARLDVVDLRSGDIDYLEANDQGDGLRRIPFSGRDRGVAIGLGWQAENWWLDLGTTPLGFEQQDWVGGLGVSGGLGWLGWSAVASRRPEMGTTLSYSGLAVPATANRGPGKAWGGVMRSGVKLGFSVDRGGAVGAWSSLQYHQLRGEAVADNDRVAALGGVYWRAINRDDLQWRLGINVLHMRYDKNLEEFSLSHGGYYSPQHYLSVSLPIRVFGRWRDDWAYLVGASVSRSRKTEDAPFGLPGRSSEGGGNGYSVEAAIEKQVADQWYVGLAGDIQRADFYEPNHLSLYFRYTFHPRWSPIPTPPESPVMYGAFD